MKLKGFTLAEVMLTLGILAMILTMAIPDISRLFADQKSKIDEIQIGDITRALGAYAKSEKRLPLPEADGSWPTTGDWADELAKHSKLSAEEMRTDAWGNPRIYEAYVNENSGYRQGSLDIYYATVLSLGEKNDNDSYVEGEGTVTAPKRTWADVTDAEVAYANYRPEGDDLVARFSDFDLKTELYELRIERLQNIVEGLEVYATDKFNEADAAAQATCSSGSDCGLEARIYYPRSGDQFPTSVAMDTIYYQEVLNDMGNIIGKEALTVGDEDDMKALMRLLNLPETYAVDPITEEVFYYYSNPKPGSACTEGRESAPFMPIVLSVGSACSGNW